VLVPQPNFTNLSSAAGLGLIGFNENDIAIDYGCVCFDSFVYTSKSFNVTWSQFASKQMNLLWDLQYLLLIRSCLLLKPCVWGYFGIHILQGFFYVICHIKVASQNMRITEDAGVKGRSGN